VCGKHFHTLAWFALVGAEPIDMMGALQVKLGKKMQHVASQHALSIQMHECHN
jgi:hypothetical protein